jgi:hypothetical protein
MLKMQKKKSKVENHKEKVVLKTNVEVSKVEITQVEKVVLETPNVEVAKVEITQVENLKKGYIILTLILIKELGVSHQYHDIQNN